MAFTTFLTETRVQTLLKRGLAKVVLQMALDIPNTMAMSAMVARCYHGILDIRGSDQP